MGYLVAMAPCFGCKVPFAFDADRVPSIVVDGVRQPMCRGCVEWANPIRIASGLQPFEPLPGAYGATEIA